MEYKEEDYLSVSGIQHFAFCRRQWALIHIEQQWNENERTVNGHFLHENAHNDCFSEKRGDVLVIRGMPIFSRELGVNGVCDIVEFHESPKGVSLFGRDGTWLPVPVEYKRGSPKVNDADRLQVCCQAMCLEEMLLCPVIETAYLFYGETKHRESVLLEEELRIKTRSLIEEMHKLYKKQYTPKVKPTKSCKACSLKELCMPEIYSRTGKVCTYISKYLEELK